LRTLNQLEKKLGITFKNKGLLEQALVHRSYLNENPKHKSDHNERLEFLGDAVLELAVTEYLFEKYPDPEGVLTAWRSSLVNAQMLAKVASDLDIGDYLLLSRGEAKDTGRARQYILANTLEAIIGSIYLDGGFRKSKQFVKKNILPALPEIIEKGLWRDAKSRFQEEAQERLGVTPTYEVIKEWGPDHAKKFIVGVFLEKDLVARGEGPSKQEAQQSAAEEALNLKRWNSHSIYPHSHHRKKKGSKK
jgi:ribonuclease III